MKDRFEDKIRRLGQENELQEKRIAKLQKEKLDLDREKYKVELKAKENLDQLRKSQKAGANDIKGRVRVESGIE